MSHEVPHGAIAGVLLIAGAVMIVAGVALMMNEVGGLLLGGVILAAGAADVVVGLWLRGRSAR